jgi:ribosomal-protein-alanine N-acetyltransferase
VAESSHPAVAIRALSSSPDLRECAMIMASSEPWITLGRTYDDSLALLSRPDREVYGAFANDELLGFVVIAMTGAFVGYVQTIAVRAEARNRGVGSTLLTFAEERIWRESPNVFMCVSSFNPRARALYERMGYRVVGELEEFVVSGHSEILLRKTLGPIRDWTPPARKD